MASSDAQVIAGNLLVAFHSLKFRLTGDPADGPQHDPFQSRHTAGAQLSDFAKMHAAQFLSSKAVIKKRMIILL